MSFANIADTVLEVTIVPSFTKIGYAARSRLDNWLDLPRLDGKVAVITGATSGIGYAAAIRCAALGATVVVGSRSMASAEQAAAEITAATGNENIEPGVADIGVLDAVRRLARDLADRFDTIEVLIQNAGALLNERTCTDEGHEATVASQVLGPFLLTHLLLPQLTTTTANNNAAAGRVITVSSGGMYLQPLAISDLEMSAATYTGTGQYARAKRAQVTLNEMLATRHDRSAVVFHAMHPGWVDTPGVTTALPKFGKILQPLLRNPEQGADTIAWLAAAEKPLASSGRFWLDRRVRPIHKLSNTRRSDTTMQREALWAYCVAATGVGG